MQKLELRFTIEIERDFIDFNGETYRFLSTSINFFQQGIVFHMHLFLYILVCGN